MKNLRNTLYVITALNPLAVICLFAASKTNSLILCYSFVYLALFSGIVGLIGLILTIALMRAHKKAGTRFRGIGLIAMNVLFIAGVCLWYAMLFIRWR